VVSVVSDPEALAVPVAVADIAVAVIVERAAVALALPTAVPLIAVTVIADKAPVALPFDPDTTDEPTKPNGSPPSGVKLIGQKT
jgi:hypothetical protein